MVRLYQMGGFFASPKGARLVYNKGMQRKTVILVLVTLVVLVGSELVSVPPTTDVGRPSLVVSIKQTPKDLVSGELYSVVRIVDGDTIVVDINGKQEKIRLIGVDTPEAVDPRKPVQCFGKEASLFTKNLVENKKVRLEGDSSQGDRDKYGRLLRYVFLSDGTLVNKEIIVQGYGHEYTYRVPYYHQTGFKTAEHTARETEQGLWAPDACTTR